MNNHFFEDLQKFGSIEEFQHELENKILTCHNKDFENCKFIQDLDDDFLSCYNNYYNEIFEGNNLSSRIKSLIALAVAYAVQCPYCIATYSNEAIEKGWNQEQIKEAIYVAAAVRGGFSSIHSVQQTDVVEDIVI